ncbi:MAG: type II secretion system protein [Candidatus Riflebacteria bacterium]|nr:type II secretion system protein [Candidatus Riflebacteria bacterium]
MKRNKGFTLIELLLVVAILAIVGAVAVPQFFRENKGNISTAKRALLQANYMAIKQATAMYLWDQKNTGVGASSIAVTVADLVDKGYLQQTNFSFELEDGTQAQMAIAGVDQGTAVTANASGPIFLEATKVYKVTCGNKATPTASNTVNLDDELKTKTWATIWTALN